ncbi:MAG: arylsulfatase, partial [Planctomycetota bacterium]
MWNFLCRQKAIFICFGLLLLPCACCAKETKSKLPNILILYTDDLGNADVSCNNVQKDKKVITPRIDSLAEEGMRFTDGHASCAICTPSRYALLTGRYHWRRIDKVIWGFDPPVIREGRFTLPEMLKEKGYHTGCIGKWHLGWDWKAIQNQEVKPVPPIKSQYRPALPPEAFDWSKPIPGGPLAHGFDYYFGDDVINFPPYCWIENDRVVTAPDFTGHCWEMEPLADVGWGHARGPMAKDWDPFDNIPLTTQKGVDYIKSRAKTGQPFFLYFSFPSPHLPLVPNKEFRGKSECGHYGDYILETDHSVGRLLDALEENGLADNTIVVFTSDNGPEHVTKGFRRRFGHHAAAPLRGQKRDVYEGGHRVPFIVRYPGVVEPGSTSDAMVSQIDLMRTFASVTGCTIPEPAAEDSIDILPVLKGESNQVRETLVYSAPRGKAIRSGDWVLINPGKKDELYNLKDDLGQKTNIAVDHPEKVAELTELYEKIGKRN